MWEIFSFGGTPYPTLSAEALLKALQLGFRNEQPLASPGAVYNIMLACWSIDPAARPTFSHLVASLQQVYHDTAVASNESAPSFVLTSPSSSTFSSRFSSPTLSTVYLTLNNDNNDDTKHLHGYTNQSAFTNAVSIPIASQIFEPVLSHESLPEQWPSSSVSVDFRDHPRDYMGSTAFVERSILVNSCYTDEGQYLQSIHKAFSTHSNYVVVSSS